MAISREEYEVLIKLTTKSEGVQALIGQLKQAEEAARTANAAVQAAATQPVLKTSQGQYTNMFSAGATNPKANLMFTGANAPGTYQYSLPGMSGAAIGGGSTDPTVRQAINLTELKVAIAAVNEKTKEKIVLASREEKDAGVLRRNTESQIELYKELYGAKKLDKDFGTPEYYKRQTDEIEAEPGALARSAKEDAAALRQRNAELKPFNAELSKALRQVNEMRKLQFAGRALTEISTAAFTPAMAALTGALALASNYVKTATLATETTVAWKAATSEMAKAQTEVGKVAADILLPAYQQVARLISAAAGFAKDHPEAVRAGLGIAASVATLAGIGLVVAKGMRLYADAKFLMAPEALLLAEENLVKADLYLANSIDKNTAAVLKTAFLPGGEAGIKASGTGLLASGKLGAIVGPILAVVGGVLAGGWFYDTFLKKNLPGAASAGTIGAQVLTAGGGMTAGLFAGLWETLTKGGDVLQNISDKTDEFIVSLGRLLGVVDKAPNAAKDLADFAEANLTVWTEYQKQLTDATTNYNKQRLSIDQKYEKSRTDTVNDYNKKRADLDAKYKEETAKAYADYHASEGAAYRSYYDNRIKEAKDNSKKLLEMEQDHQLEMRRDLEDHELKQQSLLESRDGLAMLREDQQFELERQRKEEDYAIEVGRISKEAADKLRDNDRNFAAERAQRAAAFKQTLADNAAEYKRERAQALLEKEQKLKELSDTRDSELKTLSDSYNEQLKTLEVSFKDRLRAISANILGDQYAVEQASAKAHAAFIAWLNKAKASYEGPHAASGGYAGFGQWTLGEEGYEFILSHKTTRAAEQAIGGNLTQSNMMSALMGRGSGYNDNRTIQFNAMTEADRAAIRRDIYTVTKEVIQEAMA